MGCPAYIGELNPDWLREFRSPCGWHACECHG